MERKTLTITLRGKDETGRKGPNRQLRRSGKIPAVIYGHTQPLSVAVDEREFKTKFHRISENTIIQLNGDQKPHDVLVRDWQADVLTGRVIHLDFYEIDKDKVLHTRVPVLLEGNSVGVREGGVLESLLHELDVECLPGDIPEQLRIDISELAIGDSLHVGDIALPPGVKVLNPKEAMLCLVSQKRAEEVPVVAAAEEGAEVAEGGEAAAAEPTEEEE